MPVFSTDSTRFSDVVKYEFQPELGYCRESVIINDSAQTIKVGTVMGKITATGKYAVCRSASSDGSQTPAGVYVIDGLGMSGDLVLPATTDTKAILLVRGQVILADNGLTFGTGNTLSATKTAFLALNPPILVETGI